MGKPDLALVDLNKAIAIKPDYADAYSNRAIAKSFLGDKNILPDHNKAVELQPNQAKYYYNRGAYYLQNGMLDLGCNDVQKARKLGLKQGNPRVDQMCP
jgi:Tfp pilus assembly protein PilF